MCDSGTLRVLSAKLSLWITCSVMDFTVCGGNGGGGSAYNYRKWQLGKLQT
jgi:hypothetical protein